MSLTSLAKKTPLVGRTLHSVRHAFRQTRLALMHKQFREKLAGHSSHRFEAPWSDRWYCHDEAVECLGFEPHYTYHPAWAARVLARLRPERHVDVGSTIAFVTVVSAFVPIDYYEYRPPNLTLSCLNVRRGNLLDLPLVDESVASLSCMHTVEHVGLGRYGEPVDVDGDVKAAAELARVISPGGSLLFVVPVGRPRVRYNANRVYSPPLVRGLFPTLVLREWTLILEDGSGMVDNPPESVVAGQDEGCGCFWFEKPAAGNGGGAA